MAGFLPVNVYQLCDVAELAFLQLSLCPFVDFGYSSILAHSCHFGKPMLCDVLNYINEHFTQRLIFF